MISLSQSYLSPLLLLLLLQGTLASPQEQAELELPTAAESSSKELALPCSHPGNIEHGLTDWNGTGSLAKFACYQGYYLVGPPRLVCRYGRWFSDAPADRPTCKPVVCSQPSISHGSLATGDTVRYKAGGSAVVVCDKGYQLKQSSNNRLVCREDGSWRSSISNEFPQCQEKGCLYDDLVISPPENGNVEVTGRRDSGLVYRPGSVLKYSCHPGHVVVPVLSSTRVCRKGRWDGQPGKCVRKTPRFQPRGSCPPPPLINNGYYLSERSSGEKPYVLPVSGQLAKQFEVGAIARYHCNEGYSLLRLFGQDIYRCSSSGVWYPKQPPVCISKTNNMEPLDDMMCLAPDDVAYASYRAVEGVVTPNGALHGTILEYSCNIGYRDSILPCLPSRRTCHAGQWVGSLPSCAPFEFCPPVPRIQNGYLATPRETDYRLHSIVKYGCDRGFWMAGEDTFQCQATGCWEPNALPKCIDENLISSWDPASEAGTSLWAVLVSVCVATAIISTLTAVCGVMACRKRRTLTHTPAPHWSTHVTVTPTITSHANNNNTGAKPGVHQDRLEGGQIVLPSYEEALRTGEGGGGRRLDQCGLRQGRTRHQYGAGRRRREQDNVSHSSVSCVHRHHQPGSNTASLRSGSVQSVSTVGVSGSEEVSQNPSCRALAGSLASFDCGNEGVPLLLPEETELKSAGSNNVSEHDTMSAYSQASTKSR